MNLRASRGEEERREGEDERREGGGEERGEEERREWRRGERGGEEGQQGCNGGVLEVPNLTAGERQQLRTPCHITLDVVHEALPTHTHTHTHTHTPCQRSE